MIKKYFFIFLKYIFLLLPSIKFCYVDVNCCLKVKFNDENQKDIFFSSFDDLRDIVDMEI